jgi:hypothetical protein
MKRFFDWVFNNQPEPTLNPFIFRNGRKAYTPQDLLELCVQFPVEATFHFQGGHFAPWLHHMEMHELADYCEQFPIERGLSAFIDGARQCLQHPVKDNGISLEGDTTDANSRRVGQ